MGINNNEVGGAVDVMGCMENLSGSGTGLFWTDTALQSEAINATIAMRAFFDAVMEEANQTSDENTRKALNRAIANAGGAA